MRLLLFCFFISIFASGQTKIAVLSDKGAILEIERLNEISKEFNIRFELIQEFDYQALSGFNAIWFKNFNEANLSLKQNSALTLYFNNGGGVIGDFDVQKLNSKWIWFTKMFGTPISNESLSTEKDVIVLQKLGNVDVSPLWKFPIKEMSKNKLPKFLKTVLMDIEGNGLAWIGQSEFKNKVFYSALPFNSKSFENHDFAAFVFGGILEVAGKPQKEFSEKDNLPDRKNFYVFSLSDSLKGAINLEYINSNFCIVLNKNGDVFNYQSRAKKLNKLGSFEEFKNVLDLSADPEFESNGYLYLYFKNEKTTVKRLKLLGPSTCLTDTFNVESSLPIPNSITLPKNIDSSGLPPYYAGKRIVLTDKLEVETLNNDGEVISSEPFVVPFEGEKINSISKNEKGQILLLGDSKLMQIYYSPNGQLPLVSDFKFSISNSKLPFKLNCESISNQQSTIEWEINEVKLKGEKFSFLIKKNGKYLIKMKAKSTIGQSEVIEREIVVGK